MLHVHRAERADRLVDALAGVLAEPLDDPFAREVVAVHSRGIERWLTQELAGRLGTGDGRGDGVCANVEFPFPGRLVGQALATTGDLDDPDRDPWRPDRLVWELLALLEAPPAGLDLGPLTPHVSDPATRFGAARRVVDLFDRYAVHRPEMVRAWHDGSAVDAAGEDLPGDRTWQFGLWRALRERVGVPSTAERLDRAVDGIRAGEVTLDLPDRVGLFGLTALPFSYLEVLTALAERQDVHLFLLHPSPVMWERVGGEVGAAATLLARDDDHTAMVPRHPLLASWGRDAREVQVVLRSAGVMADGRHHALPAAEPVTLLHRLQADVRADRSPPGAPLPGQPDGRAVLADGDRSVQVHACHGRTRQVEVLRDAIGHLLAADPALEPRDIVVMCPDVEQFAPLIHAVFDAAVTEEADAGGLPVLRVRLADRSLRQTNPLLEVVATLLELADSRVEASRVLDLVARTPVRRRFRLDDDDLSRLESWVADTGIRWGLDDAHRAAYDLDGIAANTWQAGLDRLLAGVAVADEDLRTVGSVVPYDDVEGDDIDRAGRLAELVARLRAIIDALAVPQPIAAWRAAIEQAVDRLTWSPDRDAWQRQQLGRVLSEVVDDARGAGAEPSQVPLHLAEVRALLAGRLRGRPSLANHRTGDLTVCTLVPMRSVPHRVVGLLGMDDVAFPRRTEPDGDDLVDAAPRVGDRDPRTEDRQLLLDALLAATDTLVVTYTGRDERTNEPKPPAVPIGELLDVVDATVLVPAGDGDRAPARGQIVLEHPLQPFDPNNFRPGGLRVTGAWSFDPTDLAGARALVAPRPDPPPFLPEPLPPPDDGDVIALDDLVSFLLHPVRTFLGRRLGVRIPHDADEHDDAIPVELGHLDEWGIGDRLLRAALAGADLTRWEEVERARGTLPPGRLADPALDRVRDTVQALLAAAGEVGAVGSGRGAEVDVPLEDGRSVVGTVPAVAGDVTVSVRYAKLSSRHQLGAYAHLVALAAADPQRPWTALVVGRNPNKAKAKAKWCRLGPLGADADERRASGAAALGTLVDLYDRGLAEPLPLFAKTSAAYAERVADKGDRFAAASAWDSEYGFGENADPEHALALGAGLPYDVLIESLPPRPDESGPGWPVPPLDGGGPEVGSRFEALALRLWEPILACREEGTA